MTTGRYKLVRLPKTIFVPSGEAFINQVEFLSNFNGGTLKVLSRDFLEYFELAVKIQSDKIYRP